MTKIYNILAYILFEYENTKSLDSIIDEFEICINIPLKYHSFFSEHFQLLSFDSGSVNLLVKEKDILYRKNNIAKSSEVYIAEIANKKFVIKRHKNYSDKKVRNTNFITNSLNGDVIPTLYISGYLKDQSFIQIYSFAYGKHIYRPLADKEVKNIISVVKKFQKDINFSDKSRLEFQTLYEKISITQKCIANNEFLSQVGDYLIGCGWISNAEQFLTHYDLHRDNMIINEDLNKVTLLDLDAIILAPNEFQPASLIMAGFFLYKNYDKNDLDLFINIWDQNLNKQKMYTLMMARSWIGAYFFWKQIHKTSFTKKDNELYDLYENKTRFLQEIVLNYS